MFGLHHIPLARQPLQNFAQRRAGDAVLFRQTDLVQVRARAKVQRQDAAAEVVEVATVEANDLAAEGETDEA